MIYTVTFNPSLDYVVDVKNLQNRSGKSDGTGENVSGRKGNQRIHCIESSGIKEYRMGLLSRLYRRRNQQTPG